MADTLQGMTITELREYALSIGGSSITRPSRKADLIKAIRAFEASKAKRVVRHGYARVGAHIRRYDLDRDCRVLSVGIVRKRDDDYRLALTLVGEVQS